MVLHKVDDGRERESKGSKPGGGFRDLVSQTLVPVKLGVAPHLEDVRDARYCHLQQLSLRGNVSGEMREGGDGDVRRR